MDGSELGVWKDDSTGSDRRARERLPASVTDHAGELEQEFCSAHNRSQHAVSSSLKSL